MGVIPPEVLKNLLTIYGVSQTKLAKMLKVKPQAVGYYLKKGVEIEKFKKIAGLIGITEEKTNEIIKNQINNKYHIVSSFDKFEVIKEDEVIYEKKNISDYLLTLSQLFEKKHLTLEEFNQAKSKILEI
jgi:predicted transcriptional regulator